MPRKFSVPPSARYTVTNCAFNVEKNRAMISTPAAVGRASNAVIATTVGGTPHAASHPMSVKCDSARSTVLWRSLLIAGSINRLGYAVTSQCEIDEPPSYGLGAYKRTRPALSTPANTVGSGLSVTLTGPASSEPLRSLPAACVTLTTGMTIDGSVPPKP